MSLLFIEIIVNIFFLLITILFIILLLYGMYSFYAGAPFVPTNRKKLTAMLELAKLQPGEAMLDLGSGDGRIVLVAARTGAHCIGIEINPILHLIARLRAVIKGTKNVEFKRADLWQYDLSQIDVMFLYFISNKMDRLHKKIQAEMKPGTRIISHGFKFPNWQYLKKNDNIYLYIV